MPRPDGDIHVLDYQAAEVRVFDSTARYLRTIVRRGEGPGEIGEAYGIFLSGDTLLWIPNHSQGTIIGVDPHGEEIRRFNKPVSELRRLLERIVRQNGPLLEGDLPFARRTALPAPDGRGLGNVPALLQVLRPVQRGHRLGLLGEINRRFYAYTAGTRAGVRDIPFQTFVIAAVNPSGGFWLAHNASYRIARTGEGGDTLVVIDAAVAAQ